MSSKKPIPQAYRLLEPRFSHLAGKILYHFLGYDQGLCEEDAAKTGYFHVAVTEDPEGKGAFFTVPSHHLGRYHPPGKAHRAAQPSEVQVAQRKLYARLGQVSRLIWALEEEVRKANSPVKGQIFASALTAARLEYQEAQQAMGDLPSKWKQRAREFVAGEAERGGPWG